MIFSKLEKDEKTYSIVCQYYRLIKSKAKSNDFLLLGYSLQYDEIKQHCIINGFSETDNLQKIAWINENGRQYRNYLNALHYVANLIYAQALVIPKLKITHKHVFWIIDQYDDYIQDRLNDIY